MATLDHGERTSLEGLVATVRVLSILVFTGVEVATLTVWVGIVDGQPIASVIGAIGLGVLVVGLGVEHVLADLTVNGFDLAVPIRTVLGLSVSAAVLRTFWLTVAIDATSIGGFVLAATVLAVALVAQHTAEDNALRGMDPLSSLLDLGTLGFSVIESVGATVWLLFVLHPSYLFDRVPALAGNGADPSAVGLAVLALTLFVEHSIAVAYARSR